jgi:hypothetical protein
VPFYLYEIHNEVCKQLRRQSLLGVLREIAQREVRNGNPRWHAREQDLLRGMGIESCQNHALIIDLKPDTIENISLYEVQDVWGFSNEEWTPLALRLKPLFVDHKDNAPDRFKKSFSMPSAQSISDNGGAIHEFLYASHNEGIEGRWRWGRNGVVNATLLWPDAFEYFVSSIQHRMREDKVNPAVSTQRHSKVAITAIASYNHVAAYS